MTEPDLVAITLRLNPRYLTFVSGLLTEIERLSHDALIQLGASDGATATASASQTKASVDKKKRRQFPGSISRFTLPQDYEGHVLDVDYETAKKLSRDELVAIITKHFHEKAPAYLINSKGEEVHRDRNYGVDFVAASLGWKISTIIQYRKAKKIGSVEGQIPGNDLTAFMWYSGKGRVASYGTASQVLMIGENLIRRLIEVEELKLDDKSPDTVKQPMLVRTSLSGFYAKINPTVNNPKYQDVQALISDGVSYETLLAISIRKGIKIDWPMHYHANDRFPLPPNQIDASLRRGRDYDLIEDDKAPADAYNVRHNKSGLNQGDYFRLSLAMASEKESDFAKRLAGYDREAALPKLHLAGMAPINYKGELVILPGSERVIRMEESEILRIVELVKPTVVRRGPFITEDAVRELVGDTYNKDRLIRARDNKKVASVHIKNAERFSAFDVGVLYQAHIKKG